MVLQKHPDLIRQGTITIGTSVLEISAEVPTGQRAILAMTNTSTGGQIISLAWAADAVAGSGIVLLPGSSWSETLDSAFTPSNARITGVSSAAGGTLAFHERLRA